MPKAVSKIELERSICRDSFYQFVRRFWGTAVPEEPIWNWHIEILCYELQYHAERVFKGLPKEADLIINIPPGTTKSTICSIMFPAWVWTRMITARCICGSYAHPLSLDLSRRGRSVVQSEKYRKLFPEIKIADDQNTKGHFANTKGGSRFCTSTGGSVTGMHGHFIIIDDPLDPNQAVSEADLKTANRWIFEILPSRKVNKETTVSILIMQRLHQDDPTGAWLEKAKAKKTMKVEHVCLPAESTDEVKPARLRRFYKDGLLDPVRLSKKVLIDTLALLGEYSYAGQFRQKPIPPGGAMFKVEKISIDVPPRRFAMIVRFWDKAGTEGAGAFSVGTKMGRDLTGRFWILDVIRGQWDSAKREEIIKSTAELDGRGVYVGVEQEPGSGGKESAENTVKMLAGWRVRVDRPTGDKVMRADPFSVQVNGGNVRVVDAPWTRDYINELRYFPFGKFKDQVDSSSGAFSVLTVGRLRVGGVK